MSDILTLRSSLAAAAVGASKFMSRYKAYRLIAHGEQEEPSEFLRQLWDFGTRHEPDAVAWVENQTGKMFFETGEGQVSHKALRFTSTPDGNDLEGTLLEVKCRQPGQPAYVPGDASWNQYMVQVQLQMQVVGADRSCFCCYRVDDPSESKLWVVDRCNDYYAAFKEAAEPFFKFLDGEEECPKTFRGKPSLPVVPYTEWSTQ